MGKGQKNNAGDDILVKGSGKAYKKKSEKKSKAGKIVAAVVSIVAIVLVVGVLASYTIYTNGTIQKHTTAAESEHYTVTASMMTYYFNSTYQNYVNQYSSYLQYMGLDTSKTLKEQTYTGDQTWFDQFMTSTKTNVQELLVLAEGAREQGIELSKEDKDGITEQLDTIDTTAKNYNVSADYYIKKMYGECVDKKVVKKCLELSVLASKYHEYLVGTDDYKFTEDDWNTYYNDNAVSMQKVDYLSYTFKNETSSDTTATTESTTATVDNATLRGYADGLAATTSADEFNSYIDNYLRSVTYAGMDEAALTADGIDIQEKVDSCKTTGSTYSESSEFSKWAFDSARAAYNVYTTFDDEGGSYTVYMLLPAANTEDLGLACVYRDTYKLVDYRYIPVTLEDNNNDDATAKALADAILEEYNKDATEDNFAELASAENYGDGKYEGGLLEGADKGALSDDVDAWAFDSARQPGDVEIIKSGDTGYYVVYFSAQNEIKWQKVADSALISAKYDEDYAEMAKEETVSFRTKGIGMIEEVSLASSSSTTAAATVATTPTTVAETATSDTTAVSTEAESADTAA